MSSLSAGEPLRGADDSAQADLAGSYSNANHFDVVQAAARQAFAKFPTGLLTVREAAVTLQVGKSEILSAIEDGRLKVERLRRPHDSVCIHVLDLAAYASSRLPSERKREETRASRSIDAAQMLARWRQQGVFGDGLNPDFDQATDPDNEQHVN